MTKKKNLKFKVGDVVKVISAPTWGPKRAPVQQTHVGVGYVATVLRDYGDGDYGIGARAAIGRIVHQRHLELVPQVINDPGDAVEPVGLFRNHIHLTYPKLGVDDIVVLKDGITKPSWTSTGGHKFPTDQVYPNQRYRILSLVPDAARVRLTRLDLKAKDVLGVVDIDQLDRVELASFARMAHVLRVASRQIASAYGIPPIPVSPDRFGTAFSVDLTAPKVSLEAIALSTGVPLKALQDLTAPKVSLEEVQDFIGKSVPKPLRWADVGVGDKVTAKTQVQRVDGVRRQVVATEVVATDIARLVAQGWNGMDLYWKDLNLTIHQDYDSWTITEIVKAKDLPKPEPKPLDQRRKYQPVRVTRAKPADGLWIEHAVATATKNGVVEYQDQIHHNKGYWVYFADGTKLKLTKGRDKVFVDGYMRDYAVAQDKTHTPT